MRGKWHIQTRILVTLIALTCAVLLTVALAFNLSVRGYIRARVSEQLRDVLENASEERRSGMLERRGGKHFEERTDRLMGAPGDAILLDEDGKLLFAMPGNEEAGRSLAEYFASHGVEDMDNAIIRVNGSTYAVSAVEDPMEKEHFLLVYVNVTAILAFTGQINLMLLIVILVAILLSVLLSRRFARSLAEPVQSLSCFASEIGGGRLEPRELDFRDVEFNQLTHAMNQMTAELKEAKQKQETFFQNVSHELRTPLTSIRGNAEGIVYGIMEPKTAAQVILTESDKLGGMVEDILYLSRMGRSAPEGTTEPLDLREVLSLCASEQRTAADERGVVLRFDFDDDPVLLPIREQDAQRLFGNLLSNAIRYAESEVKLFCRRENNAVRIRVADDGNGISQEDLPHVFERFYKGEGGRHGIGLAIVRSVVTAYHGEIDAHNDGGAVFDVTFRTE